MAERHRVAVVGILHLNKAEQRKILHRAGGSIAFVAAARTVLVVSRDAENRSVGYSSRRRTSWVQKRRRSRSGSRMLGDVG